MALSDSHPGLGSAGQAVVVLAEALERLSDRIQRDLDVEATEASLPDDPMWAATLSGLVVSAQEAMQTFEDPHVAAFLNLLLQPQPATGN